MGHCLWTGIVDEDKAAAMGKHFVSSELHSGWGVRTLATSCAGYNPVSYHCGSVWPHDNAIVAAGLIRYGLVEEAHRIIDGMLDVAQSLGGRLPELFAGVSRDELAVPAAYPTSCVPQAWAAAAPRFFVRMMLRLDPSLTSDKVWMAPVLPPSVSWLRVERIPLGDATISVEVFDEEVVVEGLPPHLELIREPRQPLTAPLTE
jgi:glycogen debranching enzyme